MRGTPFRAKAEFRINRRRTICFINFTESRKWYRPSQLECRTPSLRLLLLRPLPASNPFEKLTAFGSLGMKLDKSPA